jgi:hypothetical protein
MHMQRNLLRGKMSIPDDLKDYYADAKRRAGPNYRSPEMMLIERIGRVEAENAISTALNLADADTIEHLNRENAALKAKVARLSAPVSMNEWEHAYPTGRVAWEVMSEIIAARAGGK